MGSEWVLLILLSFSVGEEGKGCEIRGHVFLSRSHKMPPGPRINQSLNQPGVG